MAELIMTPAPGSRLVRWAGDRLTFRLDGVPAGWTAKLRTQIGRAEAQRAEILAASRERRDEGLAPWHDIPMQPLGDGAWSVTLPLEEVGFFPAKAYASDEREWQHWPHGQDFGVNVLPDWTRSGNTLYCVFPRQFGPNKSRRSTDDPALAARLHELESEGFATLPPSGKLRDITRALDHICGTLGFRDLLLLPINPTPTTFARFGRFGSPYAAQDLTAVDPALVEFDQRTTGIEQFMELTHAVHCRGGRLFLDMVINHTGWGSTLWERHPEWFRRLPDGRFQSPGAWGNTWADLVELDPQHRELWHELAEAFRIWCRRGVDGFRCDAGYKVPVPVWRYITALVRQEFPNTVFFLEGLGGAWEATEALLTVGGMQWAYSELFQNYDAASIRWYLDAAFAISARSGPLVHFSETHDNVRLPCQPQAMNGVSFFLASDRVPERARRWALLRNQLCALTSIAGGYAITNGVEWLATERVNVHSARGLAWGSSENLIPEIALLNRLLRSHPAFRGDATLRRVSDDNSPIYALRRLPADGSPSVLVLINTDLDRFQAIEFPPELWHEIGAPTEDLLSAGANLARIETLGSPTGSVRVELSPGASCCFSGGKPKLVEPPKVQTATPNWASPHYATEIIWTITDASRVVVLPEAHILVVRDPRRFELQLAAGERVWRFESSPVASESVLNEVRLKAPDGNIRDQRLTLLPLLKDSAPVTGAIHVAGGLAPTRQPGPPNPRGPVLLTNGRGAMARIHRDPIRIESKYDALLAANLDPEVPCDRHVFVKRLRAWVSADGFESALRTAEVELGDNVGIWSWRIPAGGDFTVVVRMRIQFLMGSNRLVIDFRREEPTVKGRSTLSLPPEAPVRLSLRLDLEDRGYHHETRRTQELEHHFSQAMSVSVDGFTFAPALGRQLRVSTSRGRFHASGEWSTQIFHPVEASRGMVCQGDAWSPGWFEIPLAAGEIVSVTLDAEPAELSSGRSTETNLEFGSDSRTPPGDDEMFQKLVRAARQFVVKRGAGKTVIAGYPWFLDWGRDTLIACRGLLAAGLAEEVREILLTFAQFEEKGTLPNAIYGKNASNRDTSDAALWFGIVCEELAASRLGPAIYQLSVGDAANRTVAEVLRGIACGYLNGTPNGVRVDHGSGLVWSPSHFTWMDTNHPAGTPREGYPVEIQALWIRLLRQLSELKMAPWEGRGESWGDLARRAERDFLQYFWLEDCGWLADFLIAGPTTSARLAPPCDALRSNTLLPVALGLVGGERARRIVAAAQQWLVIPGAIRSLAPRAVNPPLPVYGNHGGLLNDPANPYWPRYEGDEDTRRKPAYHNGTAWVWPFPHFCEALVHAYPGDARAFAAAQSYLRSVDRLLEEGCPGQLPEILDGDAPHTSRGCDAQAWSVTEVLRVWRWLETIHEHDHSTLSRVAREQS